LETTSGREPWLEQFNDDSLLFRTLQRKENAPIFALLCAKQSGPVHLRQLLTQCCAWSKTNRPSFIDILRKFTIEETDTSSIDEYADCMSVDSPIVNVPTSFEKEDDAPVHDHRENIQSRSVKPQDGFCTSPHHRGRLTGEVYTSKGTASGRPIYEGVKGGRYYLTPSGSKVYLNK
jgi:hypothetical protein